MCISICIEHMFLYHAKLDISLYRYIKNNVSNYLLKTIALLTNLIILYGYIVFLYKYY